MGILNQINSEKGKTYVGTSASLQKMKIDSKEKSLVELYSQIKAIKVNKKKH